MQSSKYIVATVFFVCATSGATADPDKFYAEGAVGTYSAGFQFFQEYDFSLVGARAGYDITPHFAIEGEYFVGTNTHSRSFSNRRFPDLARITGTTDTKLESMYGVFGKAKYPLGDRFAAHARLGYGERTLNFSSNVFDPDTGLPASGSAYISTDFVAYGIGGSFDLTDKLYARADLTGQSEEAFSDEYSATFSVGVRF